MHSFLADVVVVIHLLVVFFVVGGAAAVLLGAWRGWSWVRNPIFRMTHLLLVLLIAVDAQLGVICPLTEWEWQLRERAGQEVEQVSFVGRLVRSVIFYELPQQAFTITYLLFGVFVLATFFLIPPRWRPKCAEPGHI